MNYQDKWVSDDGSVTLYQGDCLSILPTLAAGSVDAVISDPPFSNRTHDGHNSSANGHIGDGNDGFKRNEIGYSAWLPAHVCSFVSSAVKACNGWIVCITDHVLMPSWHKEMTNCGRYVFAPLPWYVPGSRVRLCGDGPSSWTQWIVVSRTKEQLRWGTLPGGYMERGKQFHMGGKPVELMKALVRDYSRQGNLVCDPCMGSGTTGVAAVRLGRKFIGIEIEPKYYEIAKKRILAELTAYPLLK